MSQLMPVGSARMSTRKPSRDWHDTERGDRYRPLIACFPASALLQFQWGVRRVVGIQCPNP